MKLIKSETVPAGEVTLHRDGGTYIMKGPTGEHSLSAEIWDTSAERLAAHWTEFVEENRKHGTHVLDDAAIGDGVTYTVYTDRHAGTVIGRSRTQITMQYDKSTLLNAANSGEPDALVFTPGGFSARCEGTQRYDYQRDANGSVIKFSRRVMRSGRVRWVQCGHRTRSPGCSLSDGRHQHYDYNY